MIGTGGRPFFLIPLLFAIFAITAHAATYQPNWIWRDVTGFTTTERCRTELRDGHQVAWQDNFSSQVLEITDIAVTTSTPFNLKGSFWQVATEHGKSMVTTCDATEYLVFDVHVPTQLRSIARVGVTKGESSLFQFVNRHSPSEAEKIIADLNGPATKSRLSEGVNASEGAMEHVVCSIHSDLEVFDDSLAKSLFSVKRYDTAKLVQSFQVDRREGMNAGKKTTFIRVQFPARTAGNDIGWVPEESIILRSICAGATEPLNLALAGVQGEWTFPTRARPTHNYKTGMRKFKAGRSGGRYHAACDLYRTQHESAVAVNSGRVIRDRYPFYEGTYAIEVLHSDGKVVRYGEVTNKQAPGIRLNSTVYSGQTVGYVGKVNSGCCNPMLHFEMYSGRGSGSLSIPAGTNRFNRRSDLMDPSEFLSSWEYAKFGQAF